MTPLVKVGDKVYRYDQRFYSVTIDAEREQYGSTQTIEESVYEVIKITPKGYWVIPKFYGIQCDIKEKRFILASARKKLAYESKYLAQIEFIQRKRRQIKILQKQICRAESAIAMMKLKINSVRVLNA